VIGYRKVLVGAAAYDPISGLVLFPLPRQAPTVKAGSTRAILVASDYQEAKNAVTVGSNITPNTRYRAVAIRGVRGPAVSWLLPSPGVCLAGRVRLAVAATSTSPLTSVHFFDDKSSIANVTKGPGGLYIADWSAKAVPLGKHTLRATALDSKGRRYTAPRVVRVCK
jgi:hypothetical protein